MHYNGYPSTSKNYGTNMKTTKCYLIHRDNVYDVYIDGKKYGSGSWSLVDTAFWVYKVEGFDVEIIDASAN